MALTEPHRSPGLEVLLAHLRRRRRIAVLDLGPAMEENVRFFSRWQCRLYIEDLHRTLSVSGGGKEREFLDYPPEVRFDAVLAWDLFDHLDPRALPLLTSQLGRRCRPGALLFAMTGYLAEIPEEPLRFRVIDEKTLEYGSRSKRRRPGPRHNARSMDQILSGFTMQTSFLLRNGWQEFLFARDEPPPGEGEGTGGDETRSRGGA